MRRGQWIMKSSASDRDKVQVKSPLGFGNRSNHGYCDHLHPRVSVQMLHLVAWEEGIEAHLLRGGGVFVYA